MVSALKICFTLLTMLVLSFLPKDALADWTGDLTPPNCSISFNPVFSANIGTLVTVTVNASDGGGSGVASIILQKSAVDVQTVPNSNTLTYSWNTNNQAAGSYTFSATTSDVAGNIKESACTNDFNLTSPPPPPPLLSVSCSASPNPTYTNYVVTWTANPTGGTGTYSYVWSITDGWGGYGLQIYTQHGSNGQKTGTVTVHSGDQTQTATCAVIVNPPPKKPPQSFNINSKNTSSSCEGGKPYINLAWTNSTNAQTYHVYRQRWDSTRSQWVTEYAGTTFGSLSYKDFGIEQSSPYYYDVIAYGVDDPPAWSGWSDITYSQNCNLPPADFSIKPDPPKDKCSNTNPYVPYVLVSWERPINTTAAYYYVYRYTVDTSSYEGPLDQIYDPGAYFYDFSVKSGYSYKYAVVAVNPKAFPPYKVAGNGYQNPTKTISSCPPPSISGTYYINSTQTPYTGSFTVNSADIYGSVSYPGNGKFTIPLQPTPRGGRNYYAFYLYPPSGYNIISAPFSSGCGNDNSNIFPCSSIIYSNINYNQFNPQGPNLDVIITPKPTASCTANPTTANIGQQIVFTATSQNLSPGEAIDWTGFEDGHGHTGATRIDDHVFTSPGVKKVAIRVRDKGGNGNILAQGECPVTINQLSPPPVTSQTPSNTTPTLPLSPALSPGPSKSPYIQTKEGDVHSNIKIEGSQP